MTQGSYGEIAPSAEDAARVLFSGGQDSTTCLAWALALSLGGQSLVDVIRE